IVHRKLLWIGVSRISVEECPECNTGIVGVRTGVLTLSGSRRPVGREGAVVERESEQRQDGSSSAASSSWSSLSEDLAALRVVVDRLAARDVTALAGGAAAEVVSELQAAED